jgi:hypothetical protein
MDEKRARNVRKQLFEVINNQMRADDPPETKKTYNRLRLLGYSHFNTMKYIASVILTEMNDMLKENRLFNNAGYVEALKQLPRLPWDDEPEDDLEK